MARDSLVMSAKAIFSEMLKRELAKWFFLLFSLLTSFFPIFYFSQEPNDFVFPRIITVIRNGIKPRRVVRHLLNKKTARTWMQVRTVSQIDMISSFI